MKIQSYNYVNLNAHLSHNKHMQFFTYIAYRSLISGYRCSVYITLANTLYKLTKCEGMFNVVAYSLSRPRLWYLLALSFIDE